MASTSSDAKGSVRYQPDPGDFAERGKNYEKEVTAFVSLKALNHTDDFCLISNPRKCAPFDDIILCTQINDKNVNYLFQVKSDAKSAIINDDEFRLGIKKIGQKLSKFHIDTLYKKYPKAIKKILAIIPGKCTKSAEVKIIIFTNRPIPTDSKILKLETGTNIFSTSQGKVYKLKSNFINESTANEETTDKKSFLQSIYIYANQSRKDLDVTAIRHIKDYFKSQDNKVEAIKSEYFNCIKNWCEIESEKESLTREFVYKLFMYSTLKQFAISIDDYDEQDCQKYQEVLKESFDSLWESIEHNNFHVGFEHQNYILGKALKDFHDSEIRKEGETMVKESIREEQMEGGCEISEQERMEESSGQTRIESDLLKAEAQQRKEYAEIICNDDLKLTNNKKQLKYYIGFLLGELPLIVQDFNLNLKLQYLKIICMDSNACERQGNWLQIDENVRNEINQIRVTTSSHQCFKVEDIINGISSEASVSDVLNLIIDYRKKQINDKEISIPRRIGRIFLDKAIFSDENHTNELFIINTPLTKNEFTVSSGVKEEQILAFPDYNEIMRYLEQENFTKYKYILINRDIANINKLRFINVHFLKYYYNHDIYAIQVEWIKCNGSVDGIKKFRFNTVCAEYDHIYGPKNCNNCMKLEEICNIQNPFIIIAGVPGAGKTKLLKQYAQFAPADHFILFITLTDHYSYYKKYESVTKSVSAEEHLNYFYKKECKLLNDFFINKVSTQNIIILFDGFDEIAPKYTDTVSKIVKTIREANYKIIMTTRSVLKKIVENLFKTFTFSLNLFYDNDQRMYLEAYCNHREPKLISDKIVFDIVWDNRPNDNEFCKVPFNFHLIADVIYNDIEHNGLINKDEYKLDELKLYKKFIQNRMRVYSKKIKNPNISESSILSYHKYCSIKLLFNNLDIYEIIRTPLDIKLEDYFKDFKEGNDKVGILIEDVDEIIMIHRTVAEYLAAEWLLDQCCAINPTNNSQFFQASKKFAGQIIKIIFPKIDVSEYVNHANNDNFPVVKSFFKLMIDKSEIHKVAWEGDEGDYKLFNQVINSDIQTVHSVNNCNRTILLKLILNETTLYNIDSLEVRQDIIKVVKLYTQTKSFQLSVQNYAKQRNMNRPFFKILIHKIDDKHYIYFNRDFKLWEIFCPENLSDCNIGQLLDTLQVVQNNKLSRIFQAAEKGNLELIRQFYNKERLLDNTYESEDERLFEDLNITHCSVISGNLELIYYLNEIKLLDFSSCDRNGFSAFHFAIIFNKIDILNYYLNEGYDINISTNSYFGAYTPLQLAAAFSNEEIFEFLLEKGADINFTREDEGTLLPLCVFVNSYIKQRRSISEIEVPNYDERCFDFVTLLFKKGLDINAKSKQAALINAVYFNNKTLTKFLIENSAVVNATNDYGCTALHAAACAHHTEILKLLLNHKANIDAVDYEKDSILHYALNIDDKKRVETVVFLIEEGANPNAANADGITPLQVVSSRGYLAELKMFIEHGNINTQDNDGNTALHHAAYWCKDSNIVKYLIENKADINLSNNRNQTPLDLAILRKNKETEFILKNENGMSNNTKDEGWPKLTIGLETRFNNKDSKQCGILKKFIDEYLNYFS